MGDQKMNFIIANNDNELSETAARLVCDCINQKESSTLVFPTGNTPLGMFKALVSHNQAKHVTFRKSRLIELDEYFGIRTDDERNLFAWLDRELLQKVDFQPENIHRFDSFAPDPQVEARRMEKIVIDSGGIDLLVLGLGLNGHVGFNEPGTRVDSPTRLVDLTPESIMSSANYWGAGAEIPRQGFTLGMDLLLKARKTVLLVQGASKAEVLRETLEGSVSDRLPATYLRNLNDFTIIADREAATTVINQKSSDTF